MLVADTAALPLARTAVGELESTMRLPMVLRPAFPDAVRRAADCRVENEHRARQRGHCQRAVVVSDGVVLQPRAYRVRGHNGIAAYSRRDRRPRWPG